MQRGRAAGSAARRRQLRPSASAVALVASCLSGLALSVLASSQVLAVDLAALALGLAGVIGATTALLRPKALTRSMSGPILAWLAFMGWALVSALASGRGWSAFVGEPTNLWGLLSLAAATAVAATAASWSEEVGAVLSAVAPAVIVVELAIVFSQAATGQPIRGSLPNSTYLGELVVLLVPFVGLRSDRTRSKAADALAVGAIAAVAASSARVATLSLLAWFVAERVWRRARTARERYAAAAVAAAVAVGGAMVFARDEIAATFAASTWTERLLMWSDAWRAMLARPVVGYGPDGFIGAGASVSTVERMQQGPVLLYHLYGTADPHNVVVWVGVSAGVVGLSLVVLTLVHVVRRWRENAEHSEQSKAAVWALCMTAATLLTAPAAMQIAPILGLVLGLSLSGARGAGEHGHPNVVKWAPAVLGVMSAALVASMLLRIPFEEPSQSRSPRLAHAALRAAEAARLDPYLWYLASQHLGWAVRAGTASFDERPDLRAAENAAALDRRNPFYALEVARTLAFYGAPESEVEAAYAETFRRWPAFPLAHAERAYYLATTGRRQEAARELAMARLCSGECADVEAAIRAAERALQE
ncbi:MAG: O-antigen ligase family protein [Coriobacteriia bacterium]|nr:O-antigen ligase family protein [Coriobacteriia bacterium]